MYPKVFVEFAEHQRLHGDVSVLPTPVFFHGLGRDDELFVDIERGKTLVVRFLAIGEPDEEGRRTIFFELNGQPREVKVTDRSLAATGPGRRMADEWRPLPRARADARPGGGRDARSRGTGWSRGTGCSPSRR